MYGTETLFIPPSGLVFRPQSCQREIRNNPIRHQEEQHEEIHTTDWPEGKIPARVPAEDVPSSGRWSQKSLNHLIGPSAQTGLFNWTKNFFIQPYTCPTRASVLPKPFAEYRCPIGSSASIATAHNKSRNPERPTRAGSDGDPIPPPAEPSLPFKALPGVGRSAMRSHPVSSDQA